MIKRLQVTDPRQLTPACAPHLLMIWALEIASCDPDERSLGREDVITAHQSCDADLSNPRAIQTRAVNITLVVRRRATYRNRESLL